MCQEEIILHRLRREGWKGSKISKEEYIHQEPTLEKEEMNPTICCKALERIIAPQTLKIEGHIKKKKVQAMKDHIKHQQQVLQLLKDNATSVQNQMKQQENQHHSERSFDVGDLVYFTATSQASYFWEGNVDNTTCT